MKRRSKQSTNQSSSYQPHKKPVHTAKKSVFRRMNDWLHDHKKISLVGLILFLLLIGGIIVFALGRPTMVTELLPIKEKEVVKHYSPLTGVEVSEEDTKRPVTAVIIENSLEARPQSGLKEAGIVFESVAESGITRFLALYQESKPEIIGPVRSVRPHFASWVAAYDAGLAHVGGTDSALAKLRSGQIRDLDQFFHEGTFYRASDRYAPHNVYTSDASLQALNQSKGYTSSSFTSWPRNKKNKSKPSETPTAQTIAIPISSGQFAVDYIWNAQTNNYARQQGGAAHQDRELGHITPDVVIALQVPHNAIAESNGFRYPNVIGTGRAWIFQNGTAAEVTWSKTGDAAALTLQDSTGEAVTLNPGQTWLTAIEPNNTPTWQ